ncbi:hypothetical protein TorRG33x02_212450 [Trema orientale]|uniref:Uncharacterized protein n=1 Tax=Trema orientale TaxID=63057 RepID=A0A2P5EBN7_TREOI|nr:hypothetical protein TorRG33x02_212450 [Trema orientale]
MPWHTVFAFLNPLLIGVLQVKCQGASLSAFDTDPANMYTFLLATLVYCFAFASNLKCRRRRRDWTNHALLFDHMALISGSLSSVSLVSVFLPGLPGQLIFFSWIILPVFLSRHLIFRICRWPYLWISKAIVTLHIEVVNRLNMIKYGNEEQPQTLPL